MTVEEINIKQKRRWGGFKTALLVGIFAPIILVQAQASVIDQPFFRANALVIVFSGGDFVESNGEAPLVHDFVLLDDAASGTEGDDLIAQDGVPVNFPFDPISDGTTAGWPFQITGQTFGGVLDNNPSFQVLDANDSYTAFGINNNTDIDLQGNQVRFAFFFVASNTAFDIYAESSNLVTSGDFTGLGFENIGYQLFEFSPTSPTIGQNSQLASVGGNGIILGTNATGFSLSDLSGGQTKVYDGGRRTARIPGSIAQQAVGFASLYRLRARLTAQIMISHWVRGFYPQT